MPDLQLNDSAHATLEHVSLTGRDARLSLYGEVRSARDRGASVPGKIAIELIDADGNSRQQQVASYHRRSQRSHYSWFQVDLDLPSDAIAAVSVTHVSPFDSQ
jgi:hypothetical protein